MLEARSINPNFLIPSSPRERSSEIAAVVSGNIIIPKMWVTQTEIQKLGDNYKRFYDRFTNLEAGAKITRLSGFLAARKSLEEPSLPNLQRAASILVMVGVLIASGSRLSKRDLLKTPVLVAVLPSGLAVEKQSRIEPIPNYEKTLGRRSFYWLPLDGSVEGEAATGFNEGGPWDKYDALDRVLNGYRARSVYWPKNGGPASTRDWLITVAFNSLNSTHWANKAWDGYCMDAAAASYFAPIIKGPITVAGIEFTEKDRLVIAAMRWGGLARKQINNVPELVTRINNGEPVVVNHSQVPVQQWWGLGRLVNEEGAVEIVRTLKWHENDLKTLYRYPAEIVKKGAYILDENRAEPGYEGNFAIADRQVGGLIVGTHILAA